VAGAKGAQQNTGIVSTATYARVGVIPPSEDLVEVDFTNGVVTAVGSQFGVDVQRAGLRRQSGTAVVGG
jgi:hypothetical protein